MPAGQEILSNKIQVPSVPRSARHPGTELCAPVMHTWGGMRGMEMLELLQVQRMQMAGLAPLETTFPNSL